MIKYKVNILEKLKDAGYSIYRLRQEKILAEGTLQKMRSGNSSINLSSLSPVCQILHCQPGDLVEWVEDA